MQINVEREIIKSILFDADACAVAFDSMGPEHIANPDYRQIFCKARELLNSGKSVDIVSLTDSGINGDLMVELLSESCTASNIKTHTTILLDNHDKTVALQTMDNLLSNRSVTNEQIRQTCEDLAYMLAGRSEVKPLRPLSDVAVDTFKEFEEIIEKGVPGVKTGFACMDKLGWTFRPGTFNVIAARPSMGKSALALDIAENCGVPVAFFSLEMPAKEQFERMLAKRTGLTTQTIRKPNVLNENKELITNTAVNIQKMPIFINESPTINPLQVKMQCKRLMSKVDLGLIIVDYMGYMKDAGRYESRRIEMGTYSRGLKQVATDLNVPVIALSQLNRDCDSRVDKRPMLSDLRESGDIEQDAHMVWFVYRDWVYDRSKPQDEAELICRKNRGGKTGVVKLVFDGPKTQFRNWESEITKGDL